MKGWEAQLQRNSENRVDIFNLLYSYKKAQPRKRQCLLKQNYLQAPSTRHAHELGA